MDKLLIFILAALTAFGFSGVATAIYLFWLWSGFVKVEWTTLSSFTALCSYWMYGLTGLIFMVGSVLTTICALAMFWFDMSLQDIQDQAKETVNEARPEDQRIKTDHKDTDNNENLTFNDYALQEFYKRSGMTEEQVEQYQQNFMARYGVVSSYFNGAYDRFYNVVTRTRELTDEIPFIAFIYYYYDYVMNEIRTYIKAIISLKEISKLSRQGFGQTGPNGQMDLSALQNIDFNALLGGFEAFGIGQPQNQSTNDQTQNRSVTPSSSASTNIVQTTTPTNQNPLPLPMGGMPGMPSMPGMSAMAGMGGFDLSQMEEIERNMTPQQKKQAEDAAMAMLQNMDMSQMGDMMKMFGMGNNVPNPQNMNRAQRKKLKKQMQKKNK